MLTAALKQAGIFLTAIVAAAAIFLLIESGSPSFQRCIKEYEGTNQPASAEQSIEHPRIVVVRYGVCSGRFSDAHSGGITALASILIAAFTATLWITNGRQLRLARDEFNATHRPRIIVHTFEVAYEDHSVGAQFKVVNKGVSPATILTISDKIFATRALRQGVFLDTSTFANKILASGEPMDWGCKGDNLAFETEAVKMSKAPGDLKIWCIGKIIYADGEGRKRETGFCRSYDASGKRWVQEPESEYEYAY